MGKIVEVVAALVWEGDKFMICQRPANKARALLWDRKPILPTEEELSLNPRSRSAKLRVAEKRAN